MADDPQAPSENTPDPTTTDSPDDGDSTEDSAQDSQTPQQPDGTADKRVRDAQSALTRQAKEFAEYRRTHPDYEPDEGEEEEGDEPEPTRRRSSTTSAALAEAQRERDEAQWQLAEGIYGPDVIAAYGVSVDMLEQARTAADMVTAFEAYHEARAKGATPAAAAAETGGTQSREQAVTPRVETNRPDAAPDSDQTDPKRFEGGANGGVGGWLRERFGITNTS